VDRLAQDREVILLDNRGVGGSTGVVPEDVTAMARAALAFTDGLGFAADRSAGLLTEGGPINSLSHRNRVVACRPFLSRSASA
jgi:pimeloyl-ACP methyl ester carboxylesterase